MPDVNIPASIAYPAFTAALVKRYDEFSNINEVPNFLRNWFPPMISKVRYPTIEVRRATERIGTPVILGHQGVMTQVSKFTQKAFSPFYFRYNFDATQLEQYFRMFGSNVWNYNDIDSAIDEIAIQQMQNRFLIERAYEKYCADVLTTGIINTGSVTVDFQRKPESLVTNSGGEDWTIDGVDPYEQLESGCDFIRKYGLGGDYIFTGIFGRNAINALFKNSVFIERGKSFQYDRDEVGKATRDMNGAIYKGTIDVGAYKLKMYTYEQFYTPSNANNDPSNKVSYLDTNKVIILPASDKPIGDMLFGATPQLANGNMNTLSLVASDYVYTDYLDIRSRTHEFSVESFGIPVPVQIDKIYTRQVTGVD